MAQGDYFRDQVCLEKMDASGTRIEKRCGFWIMKLEGEAVAKSSQWPLFFAEPGFGGPSVSFKVRIRTLLKEDFMQHLVIV